MTSVKEEFIDIFTTNVTRQCADKLLDYLTNSDFFTAPASARFHLAEEGGLCQHSVNVYKRLVKIVQDEYGDNSPYSAETLAICGLLHDVCKVNFYKVDYRNTKNEDGAWVKVPYYGVDERFPFGHGEKSVFIISQYLKLTAEEAMAINWHMGGFDDRVRGGSRSLSEAMAKYKLVLLMHIADLQASYLDEERF
ncbi:MAG: HD domain-containing protein [Clostridia bacterium]|nr:HD domain-containing protein [Clostridia bacterium]